MSKYNLEALKHTFVTSIETISLQISVISEVREQKMLAHLLEVHLLPVNAFEELMLLHLWGSACV